MQLGLSSPEPLPWGCILQWKNFKVGGKQQRFCVSQWTEHMASCDSNSEHSRCKLFYSGGKQCLCLLFRIQERGLLPGKITSTVFAPASLYHRFSKDWQTVPKPIHTHEPHSDEKKTPFYTSNSVYRSPGAYTRKTTVMNIKWRQIWEFLDLPDRLHSQLLISARGQRLEAALAASVTHLPVKLWVM